MVCFVVCVVHKSGGGGFVDEFKAAVLRDALGEGLSAGEVVNVVNGGDRFGFLVAYVNNPHGDFFAFVVLVWLWSVEIDAAPGAGVGSLFLLLSPVYRPSPK